MTPSDTMKRRRGTKRRRTSTNANPHAPAKGAPGDLQGPPCTGRVPCPACNLSTHYCPDMAIHKGAKHNELEEVREALAHGADVYARGYNHVFEMPMHYAIRHGTLEMLQILHAAGSDLEVRDRMNQTALCALVSFVGWNEGAAPAYRRIFTWLLAQGADPDPIQQENGVGTISTPLRALMQMDRPPRGWIAALLAKGADLHKTQPGTALMEAAHYRSDPLVVRRILRYGADPCAVDGNGWTALHCAARRNATPLLPLLRGPPLDALTYKGETPLHLAARNRAVDVVRWLLAQGADPNARTWQKRQTPLHLVVDFQPNGFGRPWEYTCYDELTQEEQQKRRAESRLAIVRLLLEAGADPNAWDMNHRPPVSVTKEPAVVDLLMEYGAATQIQHRMVGSNDPYGKDCLALRALEAQSHISPDALKVVASCLMGKVPSWLTRSRKRQKTE